MQDAFVGTVAPYGMVVTLRPAMSKPRRSRRLAASDITTTWSARAASSSRSERWCGVGFFWDSVSDQDRRDAQSVDDAHDFGAIDASVATARMLDDGDVAVVQQLGACCDGCH
nr:hypothetical protein [Mycobacterium avium]